MTSRTLPYWCLLNLLALLNDPDSRDVPTDKDSSAGFSANGWQPSSVGGFRMLGCEPRAKSQHNPLGMTEQNPATKQQPSRLHADHYLQKLPK